MQAQASFRLVSNEFGAPFGGALPGTLQARVVRSAFPPLPFLRKRRRSDVGKYKRRLAAVALADVVGYTRMMGEDEDATVRCWLSVRNDILDPTARLFGGRLANAVGDSALAEFGDVLDAVAWSYEVQTAMGKLDQTVPGRVRGFELRIAVHVCEVVVAGAEIYGDGINIAARLQAHAPPGGLIISEAVRAALSPVIDVEVQALGALSLKNIAAPVAAYLVDLRSIGHPRLRLSSMGILDKPEPHPAGRSLPQPGD